MFKKFLYFKISMLAIKAIFGILLIIFGIYQQQIAYAQALPAPVANYVVNRVVQNSIIKNALSRGFAANDPRIMATLNSVSTSLTAINAASAVAGVGLAVAGAPVWLGLAATLGVIGVGSAVLMSNSFIPENEQNENNLNLAFESNNIVMFETPKVEQYIKAPSGISTTLSSALINITPQRSVGDFDFSQHRDFLLSNKYIHPDFYNRYMPGIISVYNRATNNISGDAYDWCRAYDSCYYNRVNQLQYERDQYYIQDVQSLVNETYSYYEKPYIQHASDLNELNVPLDVVLDPALLSRIVNAAYQAAATSNGYDGLPYSPFQQITAGQIESLIGSDPALQVRLRDLLLPASGPGQAVPMASIPDKPYNSYAPSLTNVNVVNVPNVNVSNTVRVDLGDAPVSQSPDISSTPTATSIFQPFMALVAPLLNYSPPVINGECPTPTFEIFSESITMSTHCDIIEENKQTIQNLMTFVFMFAAVLIVFAA